MKYDYLVVGAGLYGSVFAHEAATRGKRVLGVDKRPNIAGNVYTEDIEGIHVHKYGAHIFHTNNKKVWDYITKFAEFNRFIMYLIFIYCSAAASLHCHCNPPISCMFQQCTHRPPVSSGT